MRKSVIIIAISAAILAASPFFAEAFQWQTLNLWKETGADIYFTGGKVGAGSSSPQMALDVNGSILVGNGSETCNGTYAGGLRYNAGTSKMQYCNGSSWTDWGDGSISSSLPANYIYNETNGHAYKQYAATTWSSAVSNCATLGGYLAVVDDAVERVFLYTTLGFNTSTWINATDAGHEGTWTTSSGTAIPYVSWYSGEPDNASGAQHCAMLWTTGGGLFGDIQCSTSIAYFCEWPTATAPTSNLSTCGLTPPGDAQSYDGHHYKYYSSTAAWQTAEDNCAALGGHLASVGSAAERSYLWTLTGGVQAWAGGTDATTEGVWTWTDGTVDFYSSYQPTYSYSSLWAGGQPDNSGNQDCTILYGTNGIMDDLGCTTAKAYVCEWNC